jgi:hypothetical protein
MGSPVKLYQQEMHSKIGFFATWLPSSTIELGDIGVLEAGRFRRAGSLKELGINHPAVRTGHAENMSYSAFAKRSDGASLGVSSVVPVAQAELSIQFSSEGGYIFEAIGIQQLEIEEKLALESSLVQAYEQGRWKKEWVVVDALYSATSATIIVSENSQSEIVLKAHAAVPLGALPLADPKLGLTVASSSGKLVHIIAANNLRPLYSCVRVKDPLLFGQPSMVAMRGTAGVSVGALARPGIDDLLNS